MIPADSLPLAAPGASFALLAGVQVLDLSTSLSGPYATMLLGDMGAEVLKVERPGTGDDARHWEPPVLDGQSLWYLSVNRNKLSLTLDYSRPEGLAVLYELVRNSDIVVTNQLRAAQEKLGVDYASLQAVRPDLVFVSITGFGLTGARSELLCYDLIAEGYSGVMDVTGEAGGEPQKIGAPAADMLAGQDAAFAAVAALLDRSRTGRGHQVDISLVESMTRMMTPRIVTYLGSGEVPQRTGAKDSVIAIYQSFQTADDPITLGLGNDKIWKRFWAAVGRPERGEDPGSATNSARRRLRAAIVLEIQEILSTKPRAHWLEVFARAGVPAGPIHGVDEVVADTHLHARGLFYGIPTGGAPIPQVGTGIRIDDRPAGYRYPPPRLGEHSAEVLGSRLGYNEERIAWLREIGIL
ncbi:MAG: acyl-CoA transferase [Candidatus Rokubacteria bacterium GWC2_70_16]|nr:MAG: acyl-CoA transferase [Candidatus Rokubacteria bacterium GWC2_70_16]OGL19405.1 MAG: acyl-CoA transferase [Candidatus Rokubacteria bacterium RIFCSPLOWO2_12_FULL_71_19]